MPGPERHAGAGNRPSDRVQALLAERLARAGRSREQRTITRGEGPVRAAPQQERLLFLQELDPDSTAYHMSFTLRLDGPLDAAALERALQGIERRHEVLRSVYRRENGAEMLVPREPSLTLRRADLAPGPGEAADEEALQKLQTEEFHRGYDLREGPVWRALLARTGPGVHHLVLSMHHIAFDGLSLPVLQRELVQGYRAELKDGEPPAAPPVRYADHAAWLRRQVESGAYRRQLDHWRQRLGDVPPALELPCDRPRPQHPTRPGGVVRAPFPPELASAVRALAREAGATPFMVMLACYQALLHRCSGQPDVLVGTPVAGRAGPQAGSLIGMFVNTVVLRATFRPGLTFRALLDAVRSDAAAAFAHQDVPFHQVVEALPVTRDPAGGGLFQAMFVWNTVDTEPVALGEARATPVPCPDPGTAKFDLTLEVDEQPGGWELELEYDRELWDPSGADRILGHFLTLARELVARPDQAVDAPGLLADAELAAAARDASGPVRTHPGPVDLAGMVAEQAVRNPDAIALSSSEERLSHREFDRRVNRLAHHLRELGAGPERPVGVLLERSVDLVVAIVAVVRAGAPYLPLDPAHPAPRNADVLRDADAELVVTTAALGEPADGAPRRAGCTAVAVDADARRIASRPADGSLPAPLPDQLAYVFYTSGSTGRPKGVMVTHRAAHNQIRWQIDRFGLGPGEAVLLKTNVTFDDSVVEVFATLASGARLVLAEPHGHRDPEYLRTVMAEEEVTYVRFVPTMLAALLEHGGDAPLPALRVVKSAGEALSQELAGRCLGALDAELFNAYGPTETAVNVTAARCLPGAPRVTIGRPVDNTRCYVLDDRMNQQPVGVPGMLYVGGVQLARGYLGRPGLTAEQFVPDPFGPPGGRLYRTGDLVRRRADGEIEYLGRADRQVKLRGTRIELGEIESVLAEHPAVTQAVVSARDDGPDGPRLVAHVLPGDSGAPAARELRGWLIGRLPAYMVPAAFVVMDAFPQLPSGKVDRRRLPAPGDAGQSAGDAPGGERQPPEGETERELARIWAETLGAADVGRHDSFFDLGGHSLLAVQALFAVRERWGRHVPLRTLFESPTVAAFAARLAETTAGPAALPPVPPRPDGSSPVSAAEARIWFADRLDPGDPAYNIPVVCRLHGPVDTAALVRALGTLPAAHEALRTSFPSVDGVPVREVAPAAELPVHQADLRRRPPAERDAALAELLAAQGGEPFDLARGPLARAAVVRLTEQETVLSLTVHHVVADGWSVRVLLADLGAAYGAARDAAPGTTPPARAGRALGAGDYAAWHQEVLTDAVRAAEAEHWRERLTGLGCQELPTDRPRRGADSGSSGATHHFVLPPEVAARVRELAEEENCTPFMVLLAGYAAVLARHCDTDEVVLTMPVADRDRPELRDVVGLLLNTVALRLPAPGGWSFRRVLREVRAVTLDAFEHRLLPFDQVVEDLHLDGRALTRYSVSMEPMPTGPLPFADGLRIEPEPFRPEFAKAELALAWEEDGRGGLAGWLGHRTGLFDAARIERLAGHLVTLLRTGTASPASPLSSLRMLTDAERAALAPGSDEATPPGPQRTLHGLVLEQIARTPDATAVVAGATALTYRQLGERASRLARHLTAQGVEPGTLVGIGLGRGAAQPVAVLGVLLAGAAYVALDPDHPRARLRRLLSDSGAALVVTDRPWAAAFEGAGPRVLVLGDEADAVADRDATVPATAGAVAPGALAYLAYTSGTTGSPKGVRTPHAAAAAYLRDHVGGGRFGLGPSDTVLQLARLAFDASVRDLLGPLTTGARVVLCEGAWAADPARLVAAVDRHEVTCLLSVVPTLLRALLAAAETSGGEHGARLRLILTAGEALQLTDAARARAVFRGRPTVVNQYGPTEGTMTTTSAPVVPGPDDTGPAPLGTPVAGARVWIVDRYGDLAPVGVPGEVWIGGGRLADGYHGRPGLTAERFVPEPFSGVPGARAYRTGDLARREADGTWTFLGRNDDQVKIRGHRVEPAGVESVLRTLPGVTEAAVGTTGGPDTGSGVRLVAWVAPETLDPGALRDRLLELLPEHQVPALLHPLPALPRTANGKVDRAALARTAHTAEEKRTGRHAAPRTAAERFVADAFDEVLGEERVGPRPVGREDDFFARGGHSLLAARLAARLEPFAGRQVPLRRVLELRTVAALAAWLDGAAASAPAHDARPHADVPSRTDGPALTLGQEAVWRHCHREPGTAAYHIGFHARLNGPLDKTALVRALDALTVRHPVLRTRFPGDAETGPVPSVDPLAFLPLHRRDTRDEADPVEAALRHAEADLRAPFDLAGQPPARVTLVRCGEQDYVLGLTVHHIAADGWTLSVLQEDLAQLYRAVVEGRRPELPPAGDFAAHAAAERSRWQAPEPAAGRDFWAGLLSGVPKVLDLPTDAPRPARWSLDGAVERFDLDPDVAERVLRLAEECDATPFMVLFAAVQRWLGALAGAERFLVAVPVANRPDAAAERVAGPYANIVPVPADLRGRPTFRELVARVRSTFVEVWEHRDVPFELLVDAHGEDDGSRPPLCQAMFAVQNVPAPAHRLPGVTATELALDRGTCRYELHLRCYRTPEGLSGWLEYSTALFDADGLHKRLQRFLETLRENVHEPDGRPGPGGPEAGGD